MAKPGKKREYREALESMVVQFAYRSELNGLPAYTTGGLSSLEVAFDALGWMDPHPCPQNACFLCNEFATCGTNTPRKYTVSYARVCSKHFNQMQDELKEEARHGG